MANIENEAAYDRAVKRNILGNARKTFVRTYPDHEDICAFIAAGRIESGVGYTYKEGFVGSLAKAFDTYGKLTEGQVNAVRKCIAQRKERRAEWADKQAALNANRQHLGVVGKKITLTLTIKKTLYLEGQYGFTVLCICEDADSNVVIYKGRAAAFDVSPDDEGKTVTVTAMVAAHGVRDGVKQTVIQRPKVVELA